MSASLAIDDLSSLLQHACAKQTGTLIMDKVGTVLAASGDGKEAADRMARLLMTLMQDSNGLFAHSKQGNRTSKEELARIIISFKTYQYAISLTHDLILCVKSNID